MKNFITNSGQDNLKNRLIELIRNSDELKFLVGFFYFSGVREFYETLKETPGCTLKILVGLNVDKINYKIVEVANEETHISDKERSFLFIKSVKNTLNSDDFDNEEFHNQVKFFVEMIKSNKLILRKTDKPNHSKLYIFKLQQLQIARDKLFITGSSNLTKAGLSTQEEFNVEISDYGVDSAEEYFDSLWESAVPITEDDTVRKKLVDVVEKETHIKDVTPFEAFLLILKTYLDSYNQKNISETLRELLLANDYKPYEYQIDAVKQALSIIEQNNGVIIADVVGLGKTIIACAIGRELRKRGIVICPPGLVGDKSRSTGWRKYTEQFQLHNWEVFSLGNFDTISDYLKNAKDVEVVIIDEAHRFRNQDTEDYEALRNICRNKNVILLTATPFNNKPNDILSLLKLFILPKKSNITLENDIVAMFRHFKGVFDRLADISKYHNSNNEKKRKRAQTYYKSLFGNDNIDLKNVRERAKFLSKQIRDIIEPVTIRRNRIDLQTNPYYKEEVKDLSKIADPQEWFYELSNEQSDFYDKIIKLYFGDPEEGGMFTGAIYQPFVYEQAILDDDGKKLDAKQNFELLQQRNLYNFMRRMLVKRFESSFGSFEQSIKNFLLITETVQEFISKTGKYILDRKLINEIYEYDPDDIEEELIKYAEFLKEGVYPKSHKIYEVKDFENKEKFAEDIQSDINLYNTVLEELKRLKLVEKDPKSKCVIKKLKEQMAIIPEAGEPKRKYVIFSEYVDTIKHLTPIFEKEFKDKCLIVPGKLSIAKINEINYNFDASSKKQEDDYDILLTSDVISEGYNLNRAGMVINYDIPWNPVRVIQRVGRINRISKKVFEKLYIVNFFPTEQGSDLVKSREIAQNKMFLIHNTLGEDSKIFDADEEPTAANLYKRVQQNPDDLESESFYTKILKEFLEYKEKYPEIVNSLSDFPSRIKSAKEFTEDEILVFFKKGRMYINGKKIIENSKSDIVYYTIEDVYDKIKCGVDEKSLPLSSEFWVNYHDVKNYTKEVSSASPEQSLETKALIALKTLIKNPFDDIMPYMDFIRTLSRDIVDYGTLSDYTHRRISNIKFGTDADKTKTVKVIRELIFELGENYLDKEIENQKQLNKEVIIALENQKVQ
ncbi:MAG: helicase-related protein [Ignavibacteriae bacterium]|nr:helicase-related protein [Ignavibacteriota bacterium]